MGICGGEGEGGKSKRVGKSKRLGKCEGEEGRVNGWGSVSGGGE